MQLKNIVKLLAVASLTALSASAFGASIAGNPANGKKIFENGKGSVPACSSCHGDKGQGNDMMKTPRLSGQVQAFIRKQLEDFATDKRTDTTMFTMNTVAKGLSPQDRADMAAFFSTNEIEPEISNLKELADAGTPVGRAYVGKGIVSYGIPKKGVPACRSCHDYNGRGAANVYPMIGQQKYTYLVNQLNKWRDGSRANDPLAQMRKVAQNMSDQDIQDVAAFLAKASPYSPGNEGLPHEHHYIVGSAD